MPGNNSNAEKQINAYKISTPSEGELLIRRTNVFDRGAFWFLLLNGIFITVVSIQFYRNFQSSGWSEDTRGASVVFYLFAGVLAIFLFYVFALKIQLQFKPGLLVKTNPIGWKTTINRENVHSVFISERIRTSRGSKVTSEYWVALLMKDEKEKLILPVAKGVQGSFVRRFIRIDKQQAETDANQLAEVISKSWGIPVAAFMS